MKSIPTSWGRYTEDQVSFDRGELSMNYWARKVGLSNKINEKAEEPIG